MIDVEKLQSLSALQIAENFVRMQEDLRFQFSKTGFPKSKWRLWNEMNEKQKSSYNYRMILRKEICFDFEDKVSWAPVCELLKRDGFTFLVWDTGGKGVHVHLFFKKELTTEQKFAFVKHYCEEACL